METIVARNVFHSIIDTAEKLQYETGKTMTYKELLSILNKTCIQRGEYDYQKIDTTINAVCEIIKSCFTNKDGRPLNK